MNTSQTHITIREDTGAIVIELLDRRIVHNTHIQEVNLEMQQAVRASLGRHFIIDFQRVDHFSSSLLSVLITLHRGIHKGGGELRICGLADPLHAIFKLMKMERVMTIHETTEEAIVSLPRIFAKSA